MISVDIEQGFGDVHFMNHPASLQLPTEQRKLVVWRFAGASTLLVFLLRKFSLLNNSFSNAPFFWRPRWKRGWTKSVSERSRCCKNKERKFPNLFSNLSNL